MAEVDDAYELSSGMPIENVYANHANKLKALANQSRKDMISTPNQSYSPTAKKTYAKEVDSLNAKLNIALKNAPLERQAQIAANAVLKMKKQSNPNMTSDEIKKVKNQALAEARTRYKQEGSTFKITDREWEAIQSGAVSNNTLSKILDHTDNKALKARALPKQSTTISGAKLIRAKSMLNSGYTQAQVADALGVSVSKLSKSLKEEKGV